MGASDTGFSLRFLVEAARWFKIAAMKLLRTFLASAFLFGNVQLGGCGSRETPDVRQVRMSKDEPAMQQPLIAGTNSLLADVYAKAIAVSAEAGAKTSDRAIREDSFRWRINVVNQLDAIRLIDDPRLRFIALWVAIEQAKASLGKDRFGPVQDIYVSAVLALETRAEEVASSAFPPDALAKLRPEVAALAQKYKPTQRPDEMLVAASDLMSRMLYIPLSPVSGLRGVGDTPGAINKFTEQAGDIGRIIERLPERMRWQTELLLLEAEHTGAVAKALENLELAIAEVNAMKQEFAKVADAVHKAPEDARAMLQEVLAQEPAIAKDLARIESSVKMSKELVADADQVVQRAATVIGDSRLLLADAERSAGAIRSVTLEIRGLVADLRQPSAQTTTTTSSGGDDVTPVKLQAMAAEIHVATSEVRKLLAALRQPVEMPGLEQAASRFERLVDRLLWGTAGLIILTFVLAMIYRRGGHPKPAPQQPDLTPSRR